MVRFPVLFLARGPKSNEGEAVMLNIGQVVYDYTNERVVIFAGLEMLQNRETGDCRSESGFILKDGTFIHLKVKGEKDPFDYTNLIMDGKPYVGSLVIKCRCGGRFFGVLDGYDAEVKVWAKEAIEEAEVLINEHGLTVTEHKSHERKFFEYHIGEAIKYKPKMVISTPKANVERA